MGGAPERRSNKAFLCRNMPTQNDVDRALKDIIDELIVPYMVEEFLRLYGPATASNSTDKRSDQPSNSELNSTP